MAIEIDSFNSKLCELLGSKIHLRQRDDGVLMLDNVFKFPDGDHFPIYVSQNEDGSIVLSDRGHTIGHISYDFDIDNFYNDPRKEALRKQIVLENGIHEVNGVFTTETHADRIVETLFAFGQALTKIYAITYIKRPWVPSKCTFYNQLEILMSQVFEREHIKKDYIWQDTPDKKKYSVDYRLNRSNASPVFVYGIHNQNKALRTTVTLSHFLLMKVPFVSFVVFKNDRVIPKIDKEYLQDVSKGDILNIEQSDQVREKIKLLVA